MPLDPSRRTPRSRADLLREFDDAPLSALFNQHVIAAVFDCSEAKLERDRWAGIGLPFVRIGARVKYRKQDVVAARDGLPVYQSTSEDPKGARRTRPRASIGGATPRGGGKR